MTPLSSPDEVTGTAGGRGGGCQRNEAFYPAGVLLEGAKDGDGSVSELGTGRV